MFSLRLKNLSRLLTLAALLIFLYPPRFLIGGFFPRQEFLFFCVVSFAALCFAAFWIFGSTRQRDEAGGAIPLGRSWLDWGILALCSAALIATLASSNTHVSFFGTIDRLTGFVTFAYLGALYVLIRLQFFDDRGRFQLLKVAAIAFLLQALYVLMQKLSIIDAQVSSVSVRPVGALTNAAMVAGYLVFGVFLPLAGYFAESHGGVRQAIGKLNKRVMRIDEISVSWKVIFLAASILSFLAIIATLTRSALLGAVVGVLVGAFCILLDRRFSGVVRRSAIALLICTAILASFVGIQIAFRPLELPAGILRRVTDRTELVAGIKNRALSWSIAIEAAKERPIAGWGMDNFFEGFDMHFDSRLVQGNFAESWFDKTHNSFLEMLSTAGALGLAAYLFLIGLLVRAAFVMRKKSLAYAPMLALVTAYAVNNIFIFDSLQSFAMLFGVAAWIAPEYVRPEVSGKNSALKAVMPALGVIGAMALSVGALYVAVLPMRALGWHDIAWENLRAFDDRAVGEYQKSISISEPYSRDIWQYLAQLILKNPTALRAESEQYFETITRFAFTAFADLSRSYRMSARDYFMAGRLGDFLKNKDDSDYKKILEYLAAGSLLAPENPNFSYEIAQYYQDRGDVDAALRHLNDAIEKDPNIPFSYINLGFAYLAKKDFAGAIQAFERAFDFGYTGWKNDPSYIRTFILLYTRPEFEDGYPERIAEFNEAAKMLDPSLRKEQDTFEYVNLGFNSIANREFAKAIEAFERAFDLGYTGWKKNAEHIDMFIELYTIDEFVNDYLPRLAGFYEASLVLRPTNIEHYIQLAAIYKELGNYLGARIMAEKAASLDPSLRAQVNIFLKSLPANP